MSDHYRTIADRVEHTIKIERSEFLGVAFPVEGEGEGEFFAELAKIQKRFFDATHHCWAFRLFAEQRARSSDAGEPSGTAGKPILNAIEGAELFDAAVVVMRWYGGIKLGTGGLSRAYRESAADALRHATLVDRYVYERVKVIVPFDALGVIYRLVNPPDVVLIDEAYGETNIFTFDVRASGADAFKKRITELRLTLP